MGFLEDAMGGNYSTTPGAANPTSPIPTGGAAQGGTVGDASQMLIKLLQQANGQNNVTNRPLIQFPQQLPLQQHQPGDVSGNFVNPNTMGGPARNARVSLAQSIGQLVSNVENQHELKKARDVAFDMQRIQTAMSNPTPENQQLVNEILSDSSRRKAIQKALNINFMGGPDKRSNVDKQALDMWHQMNTQGQQQNGQPQANARTVQQQPNYYQQLARMMPSAPQLTPEAAMYGEMVKMGIVPESNEQLKAITKIVSDDTRYKETVDKLNTAIEIGDRKNATALQIEEGRQARAKISALARIKDAYLRSNAIIVAAQVRANAENQRTQALNQIQQLRVSVTGMNDQINANNKVIKNAQDNIANKVGDTKAQTELIKQLQDTNQQLAKTIGSMASGVKANGGDTTGTGAGANSSTSDPTKLIDEYLNNIEKGLSSDDDNEDE